MNWIIAGLALAAAIAIPILLPFEWVIDPNSPDFNPLALVPLFFLGTSVYYGILAVRDTLRQRRFGTPELELSGKGRAHMGSRISGVVRTPNPLHPQGDYRIALQCVDTHRFASRTGGGEMRSEDFVVWEEAVRVSSAGLDSTRGIPFSFQLPNSVGPGPGAVAPAEGGGGISARAAVAVYLPGTRKRVTAHNSPPAARRWQIEVSAPLPGIDFEARFAVPVE